MATLPFQNGKYYWLFVEHFCILIRFWSVGNPWYYTWRRDIKLLRNDTNIYHFDSVRYQ